MKEHKQNIIFELGKNLYMDDLRISSQGNCIHPEERYIGEITFIGENYIETSLGYFLRID